MVLVARSFLRWSILGLRVAMSQGEPSRVASDMDFQATVGLKSLSNGASIFDNTLFTLSIGSMESNPSHGSRILKINGCLEYYKERPKLVIRLR